MHVHIHTHSHTKQFSMPLENFILLKRRRETITSQNADPALRAARA